jgi:glycosyltransferase involved in cell wall biosynthesis
MAKTICFDLRPLQIGHESRGIGMHIRSVLEHLRPNSNLHFVFYAYEKSDPIKALGITVKVPYTLVQTPTLKKSVDSPKDILSLLKLVYHDFFPLKNIGIDTFLQFDFMLGLPNFPGTKKVLVAYDLIPLLYKNDYLPSPLYALIRSPGRTNKLKKAVRAAYYRWRFWLHYKNFHKADKIVSISQSTAKSISEVLAIPAKKIITIPLAPVFNAKKPSQPAALRDLTDPFVFYIGATDSRKRVQDLVAAFESVRTQNTRPLTLVLAGKELGKVPKIPNLEIRHAIQNSKYRDSIKTIGFVSDAEKLWLYQNAKAFVFPTLYEGFGLPVVEAMQHGCPVISYNTSSIPEVAKGSALLVTPGDIDGLTLALTKLLLDTSDTKKLAELGKKEASKYTWRGHTDSLLNLLSC